MDTPMGRLETVLYRRFKDTVSRFELLAPNDNVMVAVSGGKDSYTMLQLLERLRRRLPFAVELTAVHLDQQQPGYDGAPLVNWLRESGIRFEILSEDTYSVVTDHIAPGSTYCALCSRLRRGILYSAAERLGCNKIALGHHRDDTVETFLLNLFYGGKLQAMPPIYRTDDGAFEVIRPLLECAESDIAAFATEQRFPILPCNLCGSQEGLKRPAMKEMLNAFAEHHPHVRNVIMAAMGNVRPTHLLDSDLKVAWEQRPSHIQPTPALPRKPAHAAALPVDGAGASRGGADRDRHVLPVLS